MSTRHPRYLRAICPFLGALLAIAAGACSAASGGDSLSYPWEFDDTSAQEAPILDGTDATSIYPEAAFVGGGCSGTVIAPRVVLTAGHCVFGSKVVKVKVPSVDAAKWFTGKPSTNFVNKGYVDAEQVDVGLVVLDEPVQLASYPTVSKNAVANSTSLVNVGRRGPDEKSQAQPHLYAGKAVPVFDAAPKGYPNAYYSQQLIQFGDSGGPAFVAGMTPHTVAAVNSALMGYQLLARTDLVWSWIDQQVLANGGYGPEGGGAGGSGGSAGAGGSAGEGGSAGSAGGPPSGCVQEQEPNDSYDSPQSVGIATCGTIASASDEDWYTWSAPSSGIPYAVSVKGTDVQLKMWKKVNGQYYKVENTSPTLVQNVSNGAGDYYISVWSATGTEQPYRLTVIGPFEPEDNGGNSWGGNPNGGSGNGGSGGQSCVGDAEKEPNNSSDACQALKGPVCGSFASSGDHDWFSWSACGAGETFTLEVTGPDARIKMWRKVMGVDQEVANQVPTLIHGVTDGPGFYKVDVWSASNKAGDYRLVYDVSGGCAGGGSSGAGGGGGAGGGCVYPSGPYGTKQGNIVSPDLTWQGYAPGSNTVTTIKSTDFFDCDGSKGIHAIQIIDSASWCSACQSEASQMEQQMKSSWTPAGVKVMQLLVENASGSPATTATAKSWKDYFKLQSVYVGADPGFLLKSPSANAYPYKVIVNPRTMKIERTYTGDTYDSYVLTLAKSNLK